MQVKVELEDGVTIEGRESIEGDVWKFDSEEGYLTITGIAPVEVPYDKQPVEVDFEDVREGWIEGWFQADKGTERQDFWEFVAERRRRRFREVE